MAGSTIQYSGLQNTHRVGVQGEHTGQGTTLNRKEFFTYGWEYIPAISPLNLVKDFFNININLAARI